MPFYDRFLKSHYDQILEIGIKDGDSLRMWTERFPDADFYAVDINDAELVGNVTQYKADAYTLEFVNKLPDGFDLIIDDGPHTEASWLFLLQHYRDKLRPGGTLVIEDMIHPGSLLKLMNHAKRLGYTYVQYHDIRCWSKEPYASRYGKCLGIITAERP